MSTSTPPPAASPPPPPAPPGRGGYYGGGPGAGMPMAIPNAELIVYVLAVIVVGISVLASDSLTGGDWLTFSTVATAAYLLSRGLAKMRNVTES